MNIYCSHLDGYTCTPAWALWVLYGITTIPGSLAYARCPTGCALPHTCDTCGRRSCYAVDSGNEDEDDCEDWLAPCYYEELDEDPEEVESTSIWREV